MHAYTFHDNTLKGACYVIQEMKTEKHDQYGAYNLQRKLMKAMKTEFISLGLWKKLLRKVSMPNPVLPHGCHYVHVLTLALILIVLIHSVNIKTKQRLVFHSWIVYLLLFHFDR